MYIRMSTYALKITAKHKVRHELFIQLLKYKNFEYNLYYNQKATVQIEGRSTEEICIKREDCIILPALLNLYTENILNEGRFNENIDIKLNGIPINTIRYADDTIIIAYNLQRLLIK